VADGILRLLFKGRMTKTGGVASRYRYIASREKVKNNELINFNSLHKLNLPMNKTAEYDIAIEMLQMDISKEVSVSEHEFRCFVQDKWGWSEQLMLSNTKYLGK